MKPDSHVAVLGLGAMGRRVAARLLTAGHQVAGWNRTPVALDGVVAHDDPAAAAANAAAVFVCVRDDEASETVWSAAAAGFAPGATLIELSTTTPKHARRLATRFGSRFLAAPMVGSRPQIESGRLVLLAGGPRDTLEDVRPLLDAVAGSVLHVGDSGDAAALKLAVNGLLVTQLAVAGELLGMLRDGGADLHAAAGVLGALPVTSGALSGALPRVLGSELPPSFPLDLVDKDLGYLLAQAAEAPVLEAVRRSVRGRDPEHDVLSLATPKGLR